MSSWCFFYTVLFLFHQRSLRWKHVNILFVRLDVFVNKVNWIPIKTLLLKTKTTGVTNWTRFYRMFSCRCLVWLRLHWCFNNGANPCTLQPLQWRILTASSPPSLIFMCVQGHNAACLYSLVWPHVHNSLFQHRFSLLFRRGVFMWTFIRGFLL